MSENNQRFENIITAAREKGFAVEIQEEVLDYCTLVSAAIRRFDGEWKTMLDVINGSDVLFLTSLYSNRTKRETLKIQRSGYKSRIKEITQRQARITLKIWSEY